MKILDSILGIKFKTHSNSYEYDKLGVKDYLVIFIRDKFFRVQNKIDFRFL